MSSPSSHSEAVAAPVREERRREARLRQRALESSLGSILDLSRGGVRVRTRSRLRGTVTLVIYNNQGPHVQVRARVAWCTRLGFRRHMAGLEFMDPPGKIVRELMKIGTTAFYE